MKLRTLLLPLLLLVLFIGDADARGRRRMGGRRYVSNGTFGAGLELGSPFGLNGKYFLSDDGALNFGLGADGYYRDRDGINLYFDYLWHPVSLANPEEFQLPFYVGIGGRIWSFDDDRYRYDGVFTFGVRIPIGVSFDFNNVPLDIFVQLTPTIDFYQDDRHNAGFWFDFSVGIRYWFK